MDMAAGIWEALSSTAFGLAVAIAALVAHRHLSGRIDGFVSAMEKEAVNLVETLDVLNSSASSVFEASENEAK